MNLWKVTDNRNGKAGWEGTIWFKRCLDHVFIYNILIKIARKKEKHFRTEIVEKILIL